ncbi:unnamed protein product [Lactuca saligna]|uniref:Uncharacterized protein n=1 Tax=Lactuca saligna TaxID=75948 RepID=A0AA35VVR9_LACSI|nr:unnamed protein product [Lactuca saligna]
MLKEVPTENEVVSIYMKNPKPSARFISPSMQATLESTVANWRDNQNDDNIVIKDTSKPFDVHSQVNTSILTTTTTPIQTEDLILVQADEVVYHNIMQEPIINLSQSQSQSPTVPTFLPTTTITQIPTSIHTLSTTVPISTIIYTPPVSSIATLIPLPPPVSSIATLIPLPPPIFAQSITITTTSSTTIPHSPLI